MATARLSVLQWMVPQPCARGTIVSGLSELQKKEEEEKAEMIMMKLEELHVGKGPVELKRGR